MSMDPVERMRRYAERSSVNRAIRHEQLGFGPTASICLGVLLVVTLLNEICKRER